MTQREDETPDVAKQAAAEFLPVLYAELRRLAAALTTRQTPDQTFQPTALVHDAYLRLVRNEDPGWEGRRHFFGAAAHAMRQARLAVRPHLAGASAGRKPGVKGD
jgi:hypothetical protein